MTADLDRTRPVCCSPQRRGCDEVRIHSCPPRAGQYNRPVAPCQGNLLTQAAGATKRKTPWLGHGQSQNVFTIISSRVVLTREPLYIYQMLCDIFLFLLQFGIMERRQMHQNVDTMKELLHEQYVQFEASKENTQLVNEKYHDLKQILQGFHGQVSPSQLQKLEKQLDEYEAVTNTGNEVLDVLLSDKRTLCIQRGIQLTCYVGGAALDFVEELDLYSLFGNLLNNAIQAVSQLPPEQERFITLTARREDSMVTINAENPCVGAVEFRDGLPKSHRDPNYHGFGMRSM